ncbi:unnamed protein product [Lampetra fluviatilis]
MALFCLSAFVGDRAGTFVPAAPEILKLNSRLRSNGSAGTRWLPVPPGPPREIKGVPTTIAHHAGPARRST